MTAETFYFDMRTRSKVRFDPTQMLLVFLHLEKTAGTTVNDALRSKLPETTYAWRGYGQMINGIASGDIDGLHMLSGHFPYGLHRLVDRTCHYATMFRDPIERLESWYYYIKRGKNLPNHARFNEITINEWLASMRRPKEGWAHNFQAERIMGYKVPNTQAGLDHALAHVKRHFAYVCPYNKANEFLNWAAEPLGVTFDSQPAQGKVGVNKPKVSEVDPENRAWLTEENIVDRGLYTWTVQNFVEMFGAEEPRAQTSA